MCMNSLVCTAAVDNLRNKIYQNRNVKLFNENYVEFIQSCIYILNNGSFYLLFNVFYFLLLFIFFFLLLKSGRLSPASPFPIIIYLLINQLLIWENVDYSEWGIQPKDTTHQGERYGRIPVHFWFNANRNTVRKETKIVGSATKQGFL